MKKDVQGRVCEISRVREVWYLRCECRGKRRWRYGGTTVGVGKKTPVFKKHLFSAFLR